MIHMRHMLAIMVVAAASPALADWIPGDPHKMHFPQLPDPNGWDINATSDATSQNVLADDWLCTGSGPVSDIHFWGSWRDDFVGMITNVHLSIHEDIPAVPGVTFSRPGALLWSMDTDAFNIVPVDPPSVQGWLDPVQGIVDPNNHQNYFQYNVIDIPNPFLQNEGTIYWLDISVQVADPTGTRWGWKTSIDHFNDDAVYSLPDGSWNELRDPLTDVSLDMAFVITPEPGAAALLLVGGLVPLLRRRRS